MRLLLTTLTTALALALTGCGGQEPDTTAAPADTPAVPTHDATNAEPTAAPTETGEPDDGDSEQAAGDRSADGPAVGSDCAAAGLELAVAEADLPDATHETATFLLDAAVRCDEQLVHTAATESDTSFFFGAVSVEQLFTLPEDTAHDPGPWEALARLLGGTNPTLVEDSAIWAWPAAFGDDATDADWQELVDAGLYDQDEVDQMRADGYLGWRVGIDADGTWRYLTAGD